MTSWRLVIFATIALTCLGLSSTTRAACQNGCDAGKANTFLGESVLINNTTGFFNVGIGSDALRSNTTGSENTATGFGALQFNTTGNNNTATGLEALFSNTTGSSNTATGFGALVSNTTGDSNTATGLQALQSNTTGDSNTATGFEALLFNTTGNNNTANGFEALFNNSGSNNTASGVSALENNTTGGNNTATGLDALLFNTTGNKNTANGAGALLNNTTGNKNTAVGTSTLVHNETGSENIALGFNAGNLTSGDNNIDIGNRGVRNESNTIRIGDSANQTRTFIAAIRDVTTDNADAIAVVIDSAGQLGTVSSSERFKSEIKPMEKNSEAILALKPVTFHYKNDSKGTPQFGLLAEEVAKVNPALVVRDANGEIYTVRYDAVNAMLLNEFLKEHRKVEELEATVAKQEDLRTTVAQQQKEIQALIARLNRQESRMQKVNDQLEERNFAAQRVADNQ